MLVAQYADACNITNPDIATLEHKLAVLKQHCEAIARDYQSIKRTVLFNCAIAETDEAALAKIGSIERNAQAGTDSNRVHERALIGTPAAIRRRLAAYEQAGAQEMILRRYGRIGTLAALVGQV